ncbi:MAG: EI24 domain-containing protein [Planctomycetes bacterium]|nr:EI24 domain-containing protein [Planctomycetota bacterium]
MSEAPLSVVAATKLPITSPLVNGIPGFTSGFSAFLVGMKLVLPGGGLFRYAVAPVVLSALVLVGLAVGAFFGAKYWLVEWLEASWVGWLGGVLAFIVTLVIAYFLLAPVMTIFVPLFIDPICEKVHIKYTGRELIGERSSQAFIRRQLYAMVQSLKWLLVVLVVQIPLMVLSLVTVVVSVVAIPINAVIQGADLMDCSLSLRDQNLSQKLAWTKKNLWASAGLGAAASLVMLVPGLNLFVMPAGAAGATLLMIAADGGQQDSSEQT